jgi:hypothetical protein
MLSRFTRNNDRPRVGPLRSLALAAWLLAAAGCGVESKTAMPGAAVSADLASAAKTEAAPTAPPAAGEPGAATIPPAIPRKIIYNARISVVAESVTALGDQLSRLVKDNGGYISQTDQTSYTHSQQNATWVVRVPVERFDTFLAAVTRLGEVNQKHVDSQDVTQEYYDLEARIANKLQEEKRLQKHLDDSTGKLEDILAVEREITRVRGEVESMQGRIRYLANVTSLSTVTVTATEVRDYVPPVSATFGEDVSRTFARSLENLVEFARRVALAAVSIAPWIPLILIALLPLIVWWRRRAGARRRAGTGGPVPAGG